MNRYSNFFIKYRFYFISFLSLRKFIIILLLNPSNNNKNNKINKLTKSIKMTDIHLLENIPSCNEEVKKEIEEVKKEIEEVKKETEEVKKETEEVKNDISIDDIEEHLKCDVCKDFFNDPKTLFCQHTFCASCLISQNECPMCRLKIHLPDGTNNIFDVLVASIYGNEKIKEIENRHKKEKLEKELLPKVLSELNNNLNSTLRTSGQITPNNNLQHEQLNNNTNFWGFEFNINNIITWIEIAFLGYYIYSFSLSLRSGFSLPKVILNLLIIFQSITSLLSPKPNTHII